MKVLKLTVGVPTQKSTPDVFLYYPSSPPPLSFSPPSFFFVASHFLRVGAVAVLHSPIARLTLPLPLPLSLPSAVAASLTLPPSLSPVGGGCEGDEEGRRHCRSFVGGSVRRRREGERCTDPSSSGRMARGTVVAGEDGAWIRRRPGGRRVDPSSPGRTAPGSIVAGEDGAWIHRCRGGRRVDPSSPGRMPRGSVVAAARRAVAVLPASHRRRSPRLMSSSSRPPPPRTIAGRKQQIRCHRCRREEGVWIRRHRGGRRPAVSLSLSVASLSLRRAARVEGEKQGERAVSTGSSLGTGVAALC